MQQELKANLGTAHRSDVIPKPWPGGLSVACRTKASALTWHAKLSVLGPNYSSLPLCMPAKRIIYPEVPDTPYNFLPLCFVCGVTFTCNTLLFLSVSRSNTTSSVKLAWILPGEIHAFFLGSEALSLNPLIWPSYLVLSLPDTHAHSLLPPLSGTLLPVRTCFPLSPSGGWRPCLSSSC